MGFSIPSFSNIASSIGNAVGEAAGKVGEAAGKVASAVTQQSAPAAQTPAASQKPVDTFEAAPSKPAVCGANDAAGSQCLPTWGKESGGGGGPAGVNPSTR